MKQQMTTRLWNNDKKRGGSAREREVCLRYYKASSGSVAVTPLVPKTSKINNAGRGRWEQCVPNGGDSNHL